VYINTVKTVPSVVTQYPLSSLISKGSGVLPALGELHKSDTDSKIKKGIETLLKANPSIDNKILNLFLQAANRNIKAGQGCFVGNIADGLSKLVKADHKTCTLFMQAANSAIKARQGYYVDDIANGLSKLVQAKADDKVLKLFLQAAGSAIKTGQQHLVDYIASGLIKLVQAKLVQAKADDNVWDLLYKAADSAIKADKGGFVGYIANGLSKLVQAEANDKVWNLFTQAVDSAINIKAGRFVGDIADKLSELVQAKIDPQQVLNLITTIIDLSQSSHEANQIDSDEFFSTGLTAAAKLELISPKIHKALINDLEQRKNPLLYHETVKICNDLDQHDIKKLKTFLESKKRIFNDHQQFFLKVIAYYKLGKELEVDVLAENPELKAIDNKKDLSQYFAKQVLNELAESLDIDLDPNINQVKALKDWDLENLADLIVTKKSWSNEDAKLFKLLISSRLNNQIDDITEHTKKARNELTKEMKAHHLNPRAWFNAHNTIAETAFSGTESTRSTSELSKKLKVAIWDPMDIGRNLFAGYRAGSCTVGKSTSAIFKFILDPGTKYIYTKNLEGNITGYARVFLALDTQHKPKIFVDSFDGKAALKRDFQTMIPEVKAKLIELAKAIGLKESDIINHETSLATKLGSMPEGYYHNAKFAEQKSCGQAS